MPQLPLSIPVLYGVGNSNAVAMGSLENWLFFVKTKSGTLLQLAYQFLEAETMANFQKEKKMKLHNILVW